MSNKFVCKICGSENSEVAYKGPIRLGKYPNISSEDYELLKCKDCLAITLPPIMEDVGSYYDGEAYRKEVDDGSEAADYFKLHDAEQQQKLGIIGTEVFRDKIVADVGCGAGSFLDYIGGVCKKGVAIEPYETFKVSLAQRGYPTYSYVKNAIEDFENRVDIVTSFSVLEHVEDPISFLNDIRQLLAIGGKLYLSTPNANDILLEAQPSYAKFYYRKAHLWYFSDKALANLLKLAGYSEIQIIPHHRFGLANFLTWLKDGSPKGDLQLGFLTPSMDSVWKSELERTARCDYLYAEAVKK